MNVKLLLVDDHPMLRDGLRQALARHPQFIVAGEASTGANALKLTAELVPDLIVMDLHLPDMNGIEVTRQILRNQPSVRILVFSSDAARSAVDEALQAGACGYIWKQSASDELIRAVEMVTAGKLYLSPELSAGMLEDYRRGLAQEAEPAKPLLSTRDRQLLRLVVEGLRSKEIALQLGISPRSVEAYRSRLMKKLSCSNAADLVRYAIREGIATA